MADHSSTTPPPQAASTKINEAPRAATLTDTVNVVTGAPEQLPSRALRHALFIAALFIIIAGIKAASGLIVPVLLAAFIAIISWPLVALIQKVPRIPQAVGVVAVLLVIAGALSGIGFAIFASARGFAQDSALYSEKFNERFGQLFDVISGRLGPFLPEGMTSFDLSQFEQFLNPGMIFSNLSKVVNELTGAISSGVLIIIILTFIIFEMAVMPRKLEAMNTSDSNLNRIENIVGKVQMYILVKSALAFGTAVMTGIATTAVGVPYPGIWMLLTFVLNFVPVFGSLLASLPPVILAFLLGGLTPAIVVAATYMAANFIMDNMVEPRLMGQTMGLSPLVVFVALLFWGWVLGPVGMILSTPLTMIIKISLEGSPQFQPVAVLLSSGSKRELEQSKRPAGPTKFETTLGRLTDITPERTGEIKLPPET